MSPRQNNQAGFTLVEVLVAMFIFSILSVATLTVLTTTLRGKDIMAKKSETLRKRAVLRVLLRADFANTVAVAKTDEFGQPETILFAGGGLADGRLLSLSRTGWDNPGGLERRSALQAVDYILRDGVLIRRVRARFNAVQNTQTFEQPLFDEIASVNLRFSSGTSWKDSWRTGRPPNEVTYLPKLASVELVFETGETLEQIFAVGADH